MRFSASLDLLSLFSEPDDLLIYLRALDPTTQLTVFLGQQAYCQHVVTMAAREITPRYTVVVVIDTEGDPTARGLASNLCEQRRYLASLVPAIAAYSPSVLVIDKVFLTTGCVYGDATVEFVNALDRAGAETNIIVGSEIDRRLAANDAGYQLRSALAFSAGPRITSGLITTDVDNRKIPLGWRIADSVNHASTWAPSLSVQAATVYRQDLIEGSKKLPGFSNSATNPYLSFVRPVNFPILKAGTVLCSDPVSKETLSEACAAMPGDASARLGDLRGKIVILGEDTQGLDEHPSAVGDVKGTLLQANYIEALLDGRFFAPVPRWLELAAGIVFFVALQLALERKTLMRIVLSVILVVVFTAVVQAVVATFIGYYFDPWLSMLILILKILDVLIHGFRRLSTRFGAVTDNPGNSHASATKGEDDGNLA